MSATDQDLIDQLLGLKAGDALHATRHQREKVVAATQGSLQALFDPALPDLPLVERLAVAVYACRLTPSPELQAYYTTQLAGAGGGPELLAQLQSGTPDGNSRLDVILRFTRSLIDNPVEGDAAALNTLPAAGLSTPAIVALAQLIAFLSYQVRLVAGLKAMKALEHAA